MQNSGACWDVCWRSKSIFCDIFSGMARLADTGGKSESEGESEASYGKGRRLFSRLMKEECWKKSRSVPGK